MLDPPSLPIPVHIMIAVCVNEIYVLCSDSFVCLASYQQ
jgi:hypothetical protein